MISFESVIYFVLFFLGAGAIFGLLLYLINYCEREFPSAPLFFKFARIVLVIGAVLVLIGVIMQFMGYPLIVFRRGP